MNDQPAVDRDPTSISASVIIPAHNEERSIARTLTALLDGGERSDLDVVVVCNGCTDDTAGVARRFAPLVRVVEISEASKNAAVRAGNAASSVFPRVHLDADVELPGADVRALTAPLLDDDFLASAPQRSVPRDGCSPLVRWYYDVWEQLPQVRSGLFGRGVVALSAAGQARVSVLPSVMSDDLAMSDAFDEGERIVVDGATVVVRPPRTIRDLVRRRVRVATGNEQAHRGGVRRQESGTSLSQLGRLAREQPLLAPRMLVFFGVTVVARMLSRRAVRAGDFTTWQRDESSRT